jgi:hypothetical protein
MCWVLIFLLSIAFLYLSVTSLLRRVVVVLGDLAEARLGLKEEQWQQLAEQIEVIYHNGYEEKRNERKREERANRNKRRAKESEKRGCIKKVLETEKGDNNKN